LFATRTGRVAREDASNLAWPSCPAGKDIEAPTDTRREKIRLNPRRRVPRDARR
jgi:hypothetical protein